MNLVYGIHPVETLLVTSPGRIRCLYYVRKDRLSPKVLRLVEEAVRRGISVQALSAEEAPRGVGSHQGIWARTIPLDYVPLGEWLTRQARQDLSTLLILDRVTDPHNVGAIIRTASCLGCQGVLLPKNRSASLSSTVWKTSSGAVGTLPIIRETNLVRSVKRLKQAGFWIFGSRAASASPLWEAPWTAKAVIVLGNEEKGIRPGLSVHCDYFVSIPMFGPVSSLNVSVAAGMILYERIRWLSTRKRKRSNVR